MGRKYFVSQIGPRVPEIYELIDSTLAIDNNYWNYSKATVYFRSSIRRTNVMLC